MQAALQHPPEQGGHSHPKPHTVPSIAGRIRPIPTHQLMLAWWLYAEGLLTRRQLRCYFALGEMHQRRQEAEQGGRKVRAVYDLDEVKTLIGGEAPDHELAADLRTLARLGLAEMTSSSIHFAVSVEQIVLTGNDQDERVGRFWAMLGNIPKINRRRTIPVPRRTLRALAGGFSRGTTAVMLALLIRCVFRYGPTVKTGTMVPQSAGFYRIDGRTKGAWIADTFRVSRRAVTEGRQRLIELGWITPLDTPQVLLNRYGTHDLINVAWSPTEQSTPVNLPAPTPDNPGESASPINQDSSSSRNLNQETRRHPADTTPGVCKQTGKGSRGRESRAVQDGAAPPRLRDVRREDLADNTRLVELHRQARLAGVWGDSEADKLDFFALAERARAIGHKPGALFAWLVHKDKRAFITQADEDRAVERLRRLRNGRQEQGDRHRRHQRGGGGGESPATEPGSRPDHDRRSSSLPPEYRPVSKPKNLDLTDDARLVRACLLAAKKHGLRDPFYLARQLKPDWTRDRWNAALAGYEQAEWERWQ